MHRIYLDYNATTPLDPDAWEAMQPYLKEHFGNASSLHSFGAEVRKGIDEARDKVAKIFKVMSEEIYFTSGGTESANLAIKGVIGSSPKEKPIHVISSPLEHHSVLEPLKSLHASGKIELSGLPVDAEGKIDPDDLLTLLRPETALIAVMFANNEIGNIYPIQAIGRIARERNIPFFCDGVQAAGKIPIDLKLLPVDFFSFSAHKFYGPKGVGGLYIRKGVRIPSLIEGGGQEANKRGGTENSPGIIGLAVALEKTYRDLEFEGRRQEGLRQRLQERVLDIPGSRFHGDPDHRLANTLNVGFEGIESETILIALDQAGIAVSNGAACASGTIEPSHVLMAMGYSVREARGAVRFSFGKATTEQEIDAVAEKLPKIIERLRDR